MNNLLQKVFKSNLTKYSTLILIITLTLIAFAGNRFVYGWTLLGFSTWLAFILRTPISIHFDKMVEKPYKPFKSLLAFFLILGPIAPIVSIIAATSED